MKLVILGASGGCGKELVAQALARGHAVRAVTRASTAYAPPAGAEALRGEVFDEAFLRGAFAGQDAVLSALGLRLPGLSPFARAEVPDLLSRSTPVIVAAMKAAGVRRIVAISAGGVGDSYAAMPAAFKVFMKTTSLRKAYAELEVMEQVLQTSGLEVCCVRPTGLSDEPASGQVKVVSRLSGRAMIPRADVAAFMLDEVARPTLERRGPVITVTGAG